MSFSRWIKWPERNKLKDIKGIEYPGVYIIAYSNNNISDKPFKWLKHIIYIGMTNSERGLISRLRQFNYTLRGGENHGGAQRVKFKYRNYDKLINKLYVAVRPFKCNVTSNKTKDLLIMGKVAAFEYACMAEYVKKYKHLPEFNDKRRSPKK